MRRTAIAGIAAGLCLLAAPSASAHQVGTRDPFDPAIDLQAPGAAPGTDGVATEVQPVADAVPGPRRGLPGTGASIDGWIVLAYLVLAAGAAMLLWSWGRSPLIKPPGRVRPVR